jgi:uncharacterized caspase-like protein
MGHQSRQLPASKPLEDEPILQGFSYWHTTERIRSMGTHAMHALDQASMHKAAIVFLALLSVLSASPVLHAQQAALPGESTVDFPHMAVGDQWVLMTHRGPRSHSVTEVKPDGSFVVEVKNKEGMVIWHRHYDRGYRILKTDLLAPAEKAKSEAPWERVLNFPLYVGKKWQDEYKGMGADEVPRHYRNSYEVQKIETVTTPAGTFSAFKIHRNFTATGLQKNQDQYYWYAPDAKVVVKLWHLGDFKTKGGHEIQSELVSYQLAATGQGRLQAESSPVPLQKSAAHTSLEEKRPETRSEPAAEKISVAGTRWAVIVGISKYKDTRIAPLRYAAADARSFHDWLVSPQGGQYAPARARLLTDADATGTSIKKALFEWLTQAIAEDTVTIYFAGHGSPQSPDHPENLFLLPYDTQYDSVATTGFPMWDIETALKRFIRAKKVIVITDACHAGGVGQEFDASRRAGRGLAVTPMSSTLQGLSKISDGICIMSASDDNQFSQEGAQWGGGHGVFTFHLLEGLKGKADYNRDGMVSLGELIPFLSENIRRETRNAQSPTVAGRFDPALSIGK